MSRSFICIILFAACFSCSIMARTAGDEDMDKAYQNARKGVTWALSNVKVKKMKSDNKLIANDKLLAQVRVEKEINGVRVVVTGYYESTDVTITLYRTFDSLVREGYLDKNFAPVKEDE